MTQYWTAIREAHIKKDTVTPHRLAKVGEQRAGAGWDMRKAEPMHCWRMESSGAAVEGLWWFLNKQTAL